MSAWKSTVPAGVFPVLASLYLFDWDVPAHAGTPSITIIGEWASQFDLNGDPRAVGAIGLLDGRHGVHSSNFVLVQLQGSKQGKGNRRREAEPYPSQPMLGEPSADCYRGENTAADQRKP